MDLLDRLLGHDWWTTRELLLRCRELDEEALRREMDAGWGSVHATLAHVIDNVRVWTDIMGGGPADNSVDWRDVGLEEMLARHDAACADFAALARRLQAEGRLDDLWVDTLDDPPTEKSYGGTIVHVVTHGMHHRAEVLHMLARLGLEDLPEGDALGWEMQAGAPQVPLPNEI